MRLYHRSLVAACAIALLATPAFGDDRPADEIYKEFSAIQLNGNDRAKVLAAVEQKGKLALEMLESHPTDSHMKEMMQMLQLRWQVMAMQQGKGKEAGEELAKALKSAKDPAVKSDLTFAKVVMAMNSTRGDVEAVLPDVEAFIASAPKDPRGGMLLSQIAQMTSDSDKSTAMLKRVVKDYAGSPAARNAEGSLKKLEAIGKPFELSFEEAITGRTISMKDLKGKVVVIDFWATWCGPCVAEMPNMKKIYAEFKDKGVEFIGVSLDQSKEKGGLDKLKDFVAKNDIQWPQYYQGNYWQSEFSSSWGINSIPAVFLIDADGKIASINARGKLDKLLPEYLAKAKGNKAE